MKKSTIDLKLTWLRGTSIIMKDLFQGKDQVGSQLILEPIKRDSMSRMIAKSSRWQ